VRHHSDSPSSSDGFTIIEIMIVLAIAGLIALLIFQAIPALTRNSRNSARKQGVVSVLHAVQHYNLNNSGAMPSSCSGNGCIGGGTFTDQQHLVYYDKSGSIIMCASSYSGGSLSYVGCSAPAPVTNTEVVTIYNYQRCDPASLGSTISAGAGYSDAVALFAVERGSSGNQSMCQQL
jgi:prepilin-type N-terminal cleavage/methylation domain-containing protein